MEEHSIESSLRGFIERYRTTPFDEASSDLLNRLDSLTVEEKLDTLEAEVQTCDEAFKPLAIRVYQETLHTRYLDTTVEEQMTYLEKHWDTCGDELRPIVGREYAHYVRIVLGSLNGFADQINYLESKLNTAPEELIAYFLPLFEGILVQGGNYANFEVCLPVLLHGSVIQSLHTSMQELTLHRAEAELRRMTEK